MDKRKLHHLYTLIKRISYWHLLILFAVSGLVSILSLRSNNQQMIKLKQAVFTADEKGTDIEKPLRELRQYVYAHMNTNLTSGPNPIKPPIQLKYTYERLAAVEKQRVSDANSQIYVDAQVDCERRFPQGLSGSNRLPCIQEYVDAHGTKATVIPKEKYQFDFVSPSWSPDLAGWSTLIAGISPLLFVIRLLSGVFIAHQLKKHHH